MMQNTNVLTQKADTEENPIAILEGAIETTEFYYENKWRGLTKQIIEHAYKKACLS